MSMYESVTLKSCGNPSLDRYANGCRCHMCCKVNAEHQREWGEHDRTMVGKLQTTKARKKVRGWLDSGVPLREICRATGVNRTSMRTLLTGKHHHSAMREDGKPKLPKRMCRLNYEKIMLCDNPLSPMPRQRVDATSLNAAISWLDEHGVTRAELARASGISDGYAYCIGKRDKCDYETLRKVASAATKLKEMAS